MAADPARRRLLADLAGMLSEATGEDRGWAERITPDSRLDRDLKLDSVEFASLGVTIARAYGQEADLAGYLGSLGIDQIIELTVGDLADYLLARAARAPGRG